MKKTSIIFSLLLLINLPLLVNSQETPVKQDSINNLLSTKKTNDFLPGWAIGIKASSIGFGLDVIKSFNEKINLRLGGSYFKVNNSYSFFDVLNSKGLNYTTVGSVSIITDYSLTNNIFLSGGLFYNFSKIEIKTDITEPVSFGEITLSPEDIGYLGYKYTPNKICPYLGIGFGHTISKNKLVSFNFDIGVLYQGSPKVELIATGIFSPTATEEQIQLLESNVKDYKFYPFLNFQLNFKIISSNP